MKDDYIPALKAAKMLQMSPGRFAGLLRKERERLPVKIDYDGALRDNPYAMFAPQALERFYAGDPASDDFLDKLKIHHMDWKNFMEEWKTLTGGPGQSTQQENVTPKAKKSYLTIIAALCNKRLPFDITASSAVSTLKTEIEKIGLTLGEDTIRKIIKEVQGIIDR